MKSSTYHITRRTHRQKKGRPLPLILWLQTLTHNRYSLVDGASSFVQQAQGVTFDLAGDDTIQEKKKRQLNWDKKKKKFVKGDGVGADNVKLVKTENGVRLPASYRSGRFEEWKAKSRVSLPRIGEAELQRAKPQGVGPGGHRYRHNQISVPKPLDKLGKNYERKVRRLKEHGDDDGGGGVAMTRPSSSGKGGRPSRYRDKSLARVKSELKTSDQIRKQRRIKENRKAKNARPGRRSRR